MNSLSALGKGLIVFSVWSSEEKDWIILKEIEKNGHIGTIKLAKKVNLAPKNLIHKLKNYEKLGLISKENIPAKPKGRIRIFKISETGKKIISEKEKFLEGIKHLVTK